VTCHDGDDDNLPSSADYEQQRRVDNERVRRIISGKRGVVDSSVRAPLVPVSVVTTIIRPILKRQMANEPATTTSTTDDESDPRVCALFSMVRAVCYLCRNGQQFTLEL
jgi:hypothetical protein